MDCDQHWPPPETGQKWSNIDKIQGGACYVWWLITNSNYTYDLLTKKNRLDESSYKPTELIMGHSLKQGCRQHDRVNKTESAQVTRTVAACASDLGLRPCGRVPSDLKAIVNCCGNQLFRTAGFKTLQKTGVSMLSLTHTTNLFWPWFL